MSHHIEFSALKYLGTQIILSTAYQYCDVSGFNFSQVFTKV